jgi:hypothetical protein
MAVTIPIVSIRIEQLSIVAKLVEVEAGSCSL